jgi:hypothetical protein
MLCRKRSTGGERFGGEHEHDSDGTHKDIRQLVFPYPGQAQGGHSSLNRTDDFHVMLFQSEPGDRKNAEHKALPRPTARGEQLHLTETSRQSRLLPQHTSTDSALERRDHMPHQLEEIPLSRGNARELMCLLHHDGEGESEDETFENWLGNELRHSPQPEQATDHEDDASCDSGA